MWSGIVMRWCDLFNHCKFKYMSLIILLNRVGFGVAHAQLRAGIHILCIDCLYVTIKINKIKIKIKCLISVYGKTIPTFVASFWYNSILISRSTNAYIWNAVLSVTSTFLAGWKNRRWVLKSMKLLIASSCFIES